MKTYYSYNSLFTHFTFGSDKRCYISNATLLSTASKLIQHAYLDIWIPHIYTILSAVPQFQKLLEED